MTSGRHGPYALGYSRHTMASTTRSETARWSKSHQNWSQFGLEAATRLHEVGFASKRGSAYHVEYVPGSCTHRPSRHGSRQHPKCLFSRP
jgi:hypothetical protein